jgi:hypothetical protein
MNGRNKNFVTLLMAALLAVFLGATPALAAHKDGHTKGGQANDHDGDADSDSGTKYTEDNDTNDGGTPNNKSDDGDNAHPSGKDRSIENGGSGNQGKSESDPDDNGRGPDRSNGGPDKPNGSGGVDKADQDGNNGCGNDDDFEDDNEGWCGGKPKDKPDNVKGNNVKGNNVDKPCDEDATMPGIQKCDDDDDDEDEVAAEELAPELETDDACPEGETMVEGATECLTPAAVLGLVIQNSTGGGPSPANRAPSVLGAQVSPEKSGAVLPFTGGDVLGLLAVGLGMIALGLFAAKATKTASDKG